MTCVAQFIRRSKLWRCGARSITPATLRHAITTCHSFVIFLMLFDGHRHILPLLIQHRPAGDQHNSSYDPLQPEYTQKVSVSGELLTITCDYAAPWRSFLHEVDYKSKLKYVQGLSCGEERVFYACCYNLDLVKRHDNFFNQHISFPLLNFHLKKTKVEISRRSGLHWLNELPGMR